VRQPSEVSTATGPRPEPPPTTPGPSVAANERISARS
jgi:hypothetical protein